MVCLRAISLLAEINSKEDKNPALKPVYAMACMICVCNVFKDFGKFKFVSQNETNILLVEFKIQLPFRLTIEKF